MIKLILISTGFIISLYVSDISCAAFSSFSSESRFTSLEEFEQSAKAFNPAKDKGYWGYQLSDIQIGQPEDSTTGKIAIGSSIKDIQQLWVGNQKAIYFITSNPPTVATRSVVALLVLLTRFKNEWRITDHERYEAYGSESDIRCNFISYSQAPDRTEGKAVNLQINIDEGGRGLQDSKTQIVRVNDWQDCFQRDRL